MDYLYGHLTVANNRNLTINTKKGYLHLFYPKYLERSVKYMPIIKPVFTATSTITGDITVATATSVAPTPTRFTAFVTAPMVTGGTTTVPAGSFINDIGTAITTLPEVTANSYANLYINGVMQPTIVYTLTTTDLVIDDDVTVGTPVIVELVAHAATSTSTPTSTLAVTTVINT